MPLLVAVDERVDGALGMLLHEPRVIHDVVRVRLLVRLDLLFHLGVVAKSERLGFLGFGSFFGFGFDGHMRMVYAAAL